jgi:F-type H+-transporting ATPase subunit b
MGRRVNRTGRRKTWVLAGTGLVTALVTAWSMWAYSQTPDANRKSAPAHAASHEAREAAPAEDEEPGPINWVEFGKETPPFIAMVVNIGILAAGYYLIGKKPIAAALHNRRKAIAKEIEEAARMRREAEERAKTYQARLDRLDEEMRSAHEALVRAGEAERDRIIAEAEASAGRLRKDAQFLIEQEVKQIQQDLWRETLDSAVTAAEELLKRRVTPADQERLAEDYLGDLGAKPKGAISGAAARPSDSGAENAS